MHKQDQPPQDESPASQAADISSGNEYDRPMQQNDDDKHSYVYAFCITFRNNVNIAAYLQFVSRTFPELQIRHTFLASKGLLIAVEFLAHGQAALLVELREELIRRHGCE